MENTKKTEPKVSKAEVDRLIEKWGDFVDGLTLRKVYLEKVEAYQKKEAAGTELEVSYETQSEYSQSENDLSVKVRYVVYARDGRRVIVKIDCTFVLEYESAETVDEKVFRLYQHNTLHLNVFPYVRELVQSMTSRMGLPSLTLPLFKSRMPRRRDEAEIFQ